MMLSRMKTKTKGIFAYLIVGLITIPFLLTGIDQYQESSNIDGIKVGSDFVTKAEIESEVKWRMKKIQEMPEWLEELDDFSEESVYRQSKKDLVERKKIELYAKQSGQVVSDREARNQIKKEDIFYENGTFSLNRYHEILQMNSLSTYSYEQIVKDALLSQKAGYFLLQNEYAQGMIDGIKEILNSAAKVLMIEIKPNMEAYVEPSMKELEVFYGGLSEKPRSKKSITVDYIKVEDGMVKEGLEISEQKVVSEYESYVLAHKKNSKVTIKQHIYETSDEAQEAIDEELLDNVGKELADVHVMDFDEDMEMNIISKSQGESLIHQTDFGWHAIKILKMGSGIVPFEEKRDELTKNLMQEVFEIEKQKLIQELNNLMYEEGLSAVNDHVSGQIQTLKTDNEQKLIWDKESNELIWDGSNEGEGVASKGDDVYYYKVTRVVPSRTLTVDESKEELKNMYKAQYKLDSSKGLAKIWVDSSESPEGMDEVIIQSNYMDSDGIGLDRMVTKIFVDDVKRGYELADGKVFYFEYKGMVSGDEAKETYLDYDIQEILSLERKEIFLDKIDEMFEVKDQLR